MKVRKHGCKIDIINAEYSTKNCDIQKLIKRKREKTQRIFSSMCRNVKSFDNVNYDKDIINDTIVNYNETNTHEVIDDYFALMDLLNKYMFEKRINCEEAIFTLINAFDKNLLLIKILCSSNLNKKEKLDMINNKKLLYNAELVKFEKLYYQYYYINNMNKSYKIKPE